MTAPGVVLYQPEIPQNCGNIIRLTANAGAPLHIVGPTGFVLNDRRLKRAGLDYHELAHVEQHVDWASFLKARPGRRIAFSIHGTKGHHEQRFQPADLLVFGPETRGLPETVREACEACVRIPMASDSRSINLSNAVAIGVYEAWRQLGFAAIKW
ncbi:MAG: tRNA (cytidine(34)-2'-O)-methyltransferase [Pseudomonadota bacterium]